MSIVTVSRYDMPTNVSTTPTLAGSASFDLNGASQWVAVVFSSPKTVTVDRFYFRVHSATTGCTAAVRIETVDGSTGLPTGTLADANASKSVTIGTGGADYTDTFPGTFSLSAGTLYAFVIAVTAGTPSAVQIGVFSDDNAASGLPYTLDFDASASLRDNFAPNIGIGLSGGSAMPIRHCWPINAVATEAFQATSTPDTIGNRMVIAAPCRIAGARAYIDADSTGTIKLYDTDGATVLASVAFEAGVPPSTAAFVAEYYFTTPASVAAGTYWLAVEATGGATIGLSTMTFPAALWRDASPLGGGSLTYATCTQTPANTGSWTVTDTMQAFLVPIIDGYDDATGGGGGETSHVFAA